MIQSMTGFGKALVKEKGFSVSIQARSLNNRYAEVRVFGLKDQLDLEFEVIKKIKAQFVRGKIDVNIHIQPDATGQDQQLKALVSHHKKLTKYQTKLGIDQPIDLALVLHTLPKENRSLEKPSKTVMKALKKALEQLEKSRTQEGKALVRDISKRVVSVEKLTQNIKGQIKKISSDRFKSLQKTIEDLGQNIPMDQNRLEFEVALLVERSDITEELVRLSSHIQRFKKLLTQSVIGREVDFLIQEINREVNTMGSKLHNESIAASVVQLKSQLEKIREQIQNIQ